MEKNMAAIPNLAFDSGLPANVDAEKTILGAILLDNTAHAEAAEKLESNDFSLDSHRRIFQRMTELMNSQRAVDIVTLANELARFKEIESIGGVAYLASLTEGLPRRPVIEEYIRIVKDKSLLRKLMLICSAAIARAADQGESALGVLDETEAKLLEVSEQGLTQGFQSLDQIVQNSFG
jgi:replicative DNA helicase